MFRFYMKLDFCPLPLPPVSIKSFLFLSLDALLHVSAAL